MAVEEKLKDTKLKVTVNHGEENGKVVRSTKAYGDIKPAATKEQLRSAYKHITGMQEPIGESCERVATSDITEIV